MRWTVSEVDNGSGCVKAYETAALNRAVKWLQVSPWKSAMPNDKTGVLFGLSVQLSLESLILTSFQKAYFITVTAALRHPFHQSTHLK